MPSIVGGRLGVLTMGLFSQIPGISLDYTKLQATIDAITGETVQRRAMHVILYDAVTGGPIATSPTGPAAIAQRTLGGGSITIDSTSTGKALSASDYLCQAVQVTSIRSDWTANTGTIGIGNTTTWYSAVGPMGGLAIEAPIGGVLNLKNVIIYGSVIGDQVKFLVLNSI